MSDSDSDNEERRQKLIENISKQINKENKPIKFNKKTNVINESITESEYSIGTNQATLNDLLGAIDNSDLNSKIKKLSKGQAPLTKPLQKIQKERIERKAAYDINKKAVTLWQPIVKKNREAPTLNFPLDEPKREESTLTSISSSFVPETSMETRVNDILIKTGMSESNVIKNEDKELESQLLTMEQIIERRKELVKIKSIIFYEEQKRHRINKIKSKVYHKIRNHQQKRQLTKERESLRESDPDLARKLDEEDEMKRAKERMTLKHSTTNKWASRSLRYGQNNDSVKEALNEHIKASEELKRRITQETESNSENEEEIDESLPEKEKQTIRNKRLQSDTQKLISEIDHEEIGDESKHSTLFKMPFMKAAMDKKKEQLKIDAANVLLDIEKSLHPTVSEKPNTNEQWDLGVFTDTSVHKTINTDKDNSLIVNVNSNISIPKIVPPTTIPEPTPPKTVKPTSIFSQEELIDKAFSIGYVEEDFKKEKEEETAKDQPEPEPDMSGWGSWTGMGVVNQPKKRKPEPEPVNNRTDAKLQNVIINDKPNKKLMKYTHDSIPYPFTSIEQYHRSVRTPLGKEWNTTAAFHKLNLPRVKSRSGAIIEPISFITKPEIQ